MNYSGDEILWNEMRYFVENLDGVIEMAAGISGYDVVKVLVSV